MTAPDPVVEHEHVFVDEWCSCGRNEFFEVPPPDPGLTDLIAAHQAGDRWTDFEYPSIFSDKPFVATTVRKMVNCSCGESMPADDHSAHVALVVEQHTNRRHEWPKTTPTGHTYERPTTYDELNGITADMAQGEIEGWEKTELPPEPTWPMVTLAQREIYRQSVRITELEERIAEAQSLCHDTGRYNAARQKHWNIRVFACDVLAALKGRAALEGEQQ